MRILFYGRFRRWDFGPIPNEVYLTQALRDLGVSVETTEHDIQPGYDVYFFTSAVTLKGIEFLERARQFGKTAFWNLDCVHVWNREKVYYPYYKLCDVVFTSDILNLTQNEVRCMGACFPISEQQEKRILEPRVHYDFDVIFTGHLYSEERKALCQTLSNALGKRFAVFNSQLRNFIIEDKLLDTILRSKIVLCDNVRNDIPGYWSSRIYEVLGYGGFALHPYVPMLENDFSLYDHLGVWQDRNNILDDIHYWLVNDEERERRRVLGFKHVRQHHTYLDRARAIVKELNKIVPVRLNLGAGNDIRRGYINIDCRKLKGIDLVHDLRSKLPFDENSVSEIIAWDILEHLPRKQAKEALRDWIRVLKIGGEIEIQTPDLRELYSYVTDPNNPSKKLHSWEWLETRLYGEQDYPENQHYCGWVAETLKRELESLGCQVKNLIYINGNVRIRARKYGTYIGSGKITT